jgi:hypothetical protein
MPRDGTETYVLPFPDVVSNTSIESPVYNGFTSDIAQDLNTPRPVKYGGTGANNVADAMATMGGEVARQVVTNYDSHVFTPGSFYSSSSASGAPVGSRAFAGICYSSDLAAVPPAPPVNQNLIIEARDQNDTAVPGRIYIREKKAGVWSAWAVERVIGGQTTIGGFRFTTYTVPGAVGGNAGTTFTPDAYNGNYQIINNAGAHTWAVPNADSALDVLVVNGGGAGVITFSGYTVGSNTGDLLTATPGQMFIISLRRFSPTVSTYVIKALQ